jgi:exonuclease III
VPTIRSSVSIKGGVAERRVVGSKDSPTVVRSEAGDFTISNNPAPECPEMSRLRCIFWNSNGWEQERCDKIAELAVEEEADVICICDARMHPARELHLKSYEKKLEKITGKKWKGKITHRPEKTKGCLIGGSILFTSHNCADVRRIGILKYGVMDKISLRWKKERIEIISTYKPYPNTAKGSLLTAVDDGEGDFEGRYWRLLKQISEDGPVVIGGDFNMNEEKMDEVLKRTHIKRV